MAMIAEHRSDLKPFTGNGDFSIWPKNSWVEQESLCLTLKISYYDATNSVLKYSDNLFIDEC